MFGAPRVEKHLMHKIILIEQNGIIIVVNTSAMRVREREVWHAEIWNSFECNLTN